MKVATIALLVLLVASSVFAQEITVSGTVTLKKPPEIATFEMTVAGKGKSGDAAQAAMLKSIASVQAALKQLGVKVYSTGYRIIEDRVLEEDQKTGRQRQIIVGFIASTGYHIQFDDLNKLPRGLEISSLPGVARVSGLRFDLRDRGSAEREARAAAVRDARANAETLAGGTNYRVVKIQQNRVEFRDLFGEIELPMDSIRSGGQGILDDFGRSLGGTSAAVMAGAGPFDNSVIIPSDTEITASVVISC